MSVSEKKGLIYCRTKHFTGPRRSDKKQNIFLEDDSKQYLGLEGSDSVYFTVLFFQLFLQLLYLLL